YYGLLPQDYHLGELLREHRLWWRPEVLLRRDALLTDAFLSLATDLQYGRREKQSPDSISGVLLRDVLSGDGVRRTLESRQPRQRQYHALRAALGTLLSGADSATRSALL